MNCNSSLPAGQSGNGTAGGVGGGGGSNPRPNQSFNSGGSNAVPSKKNWVGI